MSFVINAANYFAFSGEINIIVCSVDLDKCSCRTNVLFNSNLIISRLLLRIVEEENQLPWSKV